MKVLRVFAPPEQSNTVRAISLAIMPNATAHASALGLPRRSRMPSQTTAHLGRGAYKLTAALVFLAPATSACPNGWTPSRANGTWGRRCFLVPPEPSTSLFRCVELCEEQGGTPACLNSTEENAFVKAELAAPDGLWLGLYQNEKGLGPAKGWGRCVAGDAPSFSNWHESQPDDYHGYQQDCAWLDARSGQWRALACDGGVQFDPRPWRLAKLSCLCARGSASAAFTDNVEALEAATGYNQRLLRRRTTAAFAVAIALAMLPTLLLLGLAAWRRLRRGADAESSVGAKGTDTSRSAPAAALSTSSDAASSAAGVKGRLRAARASAAERRLRVSFAMFQAGWAVGPICYMPTSMAYTGQSIEAAVGNLNWWLVPSMFGAWLVCLALFPTDARAIRFTCAVAFVLFGAVVCPLFIAGSLAGVTSWIGFLWAALSLATACALVPTLRCRGNRAMQPRPALRRLWTVGRLLFLGAGVLAAASCIADYVQGDNRLDHWAHATLSVACLLCAALATPRNRGRIHHRLGRLGARGTEAEQAAAVSALVGGGDPDATLDRASKLLRCLPGSRLLAADLAGSGLGVSTSATELAAKTVPAAMGEVTAFLSHSWRDEDEAPGAKHALVSRWVRRRKEATGREPTLWLVARSPVYAAPFPVMHARYTRALRLARRRTRRASTRITSSSRSPACPSSSRAARRCSLWLGPRTAHGCGASWRSLRLLAVSACRSNLDGAPTPAPRPNRSLTPLCRSMRCFVRVCQWAAPKSASRSISLHTQTTIKRKHGGS